MRILYSTQGISLDLWHAVSTYLRQKGETVQAGYYVCDSRHYQSFCRANPGFPGPDDLVLKEWEILERARNAKVDLGLIRRFEERIGDPNLWGPLVGDRRIYQGRQMSYRQAYAPRYAHSEMLAILQEALVGFEAFFEAVRPEAVISLYAATFGDYVAYLFGRARGAATLDVRLARIRNYVVAAESIFEPSAYVNSRFRRFLENGCPPELAASALEFVTTFREGKPIYEGMILGNRVRKNRLRAWGSSARNVARAVKFYKDRFSADHQLQDLAARDLYREILNPLKQRYATRKFERHSLSADQLTDLDYAFYPMHTEPEIAMSLWARPYLNQIEVIRLISHSLPVGWKLVVKEHPATFGRRSTKYYQKLLEIPNVCLVPPNTIAADVIRPAKLVCILTSTVGLESLMLRRPLVALGASPYDAFPKTMFRRVCNPYDLPSAIDELLRAYAHDEGALLSYIAALMDCGVPVNLVTDLLGKTKGRFQEKDAGTAQAMADHPHLPVLADYVWNRIHE